MVEVVSDHVQRFLQRAGALAHGDHFRQHFGEALHALHAVGNAAAPLHALLHLPDAQREHIIVRDLADDAQHRLHRKTGGEHGGHGGGELPRQVQGVEPPQGRPPQRVARDGQLAPLRPLEGQVADGQQSQNKQDHPPPFRQKGAGAHQPPGHRGQVRTQVRKGGGKGGDCHHHDDGEHDDGRDDDHDGIGHGADDLGPGLGGFVIILVETLEARFQRAGLLTGPDGLYKGLGQAGDVGLKALGHGVARADVLGDLVEHPRQVLVPVLARDHFHAAHHRKPRAQNDGKLRADQSQILFLDPGPDGAGKNTVLFLPHLLQLDHKRAGIPQLGDCIIFIIGADHTGNLGALRRLSLITIGRHAVSPALFIRPMWS